MLSRIFDSAEHRGAGQPDRREYPAEQQRPAADLESALRLDHPPDVGGVALAEVGDHALLERVELRAERLGLLVGQSYRLAGDLLLDHALGGGDLLVGVDGLNGHGSISFRQRVCSSKRDVDVADGHGHADLHVLRVDARDRAGDEVAHRAAGLATGAAVADAHPASALRGQARGLGLLQQRPAVVVDGDAAVCELHTAA